MHGRAYPIQLSEVMSYIEPIALSSTFMAAMVSFIQVFPYGSQKTSDTLKLPSDVLTYNDHRSINHGMIKEKRDEAIGLVDRGTFQAVLQCYVRKYLPITTFYVGSFQLE